METGNAEQNSHDPRQTWTSSSEVESNNEVNKLSVQQKQLKIGTSSLISGSNLHTSLRDMSDPDKVIQDNHSDVSITPGMHSSPAPVAVDPDQHNTSTSILQQTYGSDIFNLVTNVQLPSIPVSMESEVVTSSSRPSVLDSSVLATEDPAVALQHLYSTVSTLQQMLARNAQFLPKTTNSGVPATQTVVDTTDKYPHVDSLQSDFSHYYLKGENLHHQNSHSTHLPEMTGPNILSYKTLEVNPENLKLNNENVMSNRSSNEFTSVSMPSVLDLKSSTETKPVQNPTISACSQSQMLGHFNGDDKVHRFLLNQKQVVEEAYYNHNNIQSEQFYPNHEVPNVISENPKLCDEETSCNKTNEESRVAEPAIGLSEKKFVSVGCMTDKEPLVGNRNHSLSTGCVCDHRANAVKQGTEVHGENVKINKSKSQPIKYFTCGGCLSSFRNICCLHVHLKEHASGGSYHFDHVSRTAFPKYDTFCSYAQTDFPVEAVQGINDMAAVKEEAKMQEEKHMEKVIVTRRAAKRHEEQSLKDEQTVLVKSGRKRKQDHPKPSKPRMYIVPLETKSKKDKRTKAEGRTKKAGNKVSESKIDITDENSINKNSENSASEDTVNNTNTVLKEKACLEEVVRSLCEVQEDSAGSDGEDSSAMSKPFKKRGRARKTISEISKSNTKDVNKKVTNKSKKNKKQSVQGTTEQQTKDNYDAVSDVHEEDPTLAEDVSDIEMEDHADDDDTSEEVSNSKRRKTQKEKFKVCDICGRNIPKFKYIFHLRSHTGERPFICEKCGKSFARARFLAKHLITHQEVKPWRCELCPSQFCQKNEYKMHMRGHAGERPYQCNVCQMRFLSKTSMHTHQANIHMGLTRFECEVCQRRFFKRSSLNVHQATHFEAKLECSFCDRKFRDKTGLKRHEKIHTGVKKFKCHVCNHAFIQSTPFWTHMEKRHSMSRVKVKEMLNKIKESNRRSGLKMEVNVLPQDVDETALLVNKTENDRQAQVKDVKPTAILEFTTLNTMPKFQHLNIQSQGVEQYIDETGQPLTKYSSIKVPSLLNMNNNVNIDSVTTQADVFSHGIVSESDTSGMPRYYGLQLAASSHGGSVRTDMEVSANSAINLTNSIHSLSSLPHSLQQTLSLPTSAPSALQMHGFIGLNNLQQALDSTGSLPQQALDSTGSLTQPTVYTDISGDHVVGQ